jgi:predicted Zn-dependent peptidase
MNQLYGAADALTGKDLVAFAKRYLTDGNSTTVTLTTAGAK